MSQDTLLRIEAELKALRALVEQRTGERPRNYDFEEAARLLGVSAKTVSRMVACGELMLRRVRGKRLIPVEEIDRVCSPPVMKSSGATAQRTKYDAAAALKRLDELTKKKH